MHFLITSYSHGAQDWLQNTIEARVLHIFDPVVNLINQDNRILSLVTPLIGNGPFNAITDPDAFINVNPSTTIHLDGKLIEIGQTQLDCSNADIWDARFDFSTLAATQNWDSLLEQIQQMIADEGPPASFAELVLPIPLNFSKNDPIYKRAKPLVEGLLKGINDQEFMAMRNYTSSLAGLGIGLTPAGDDFLIGAMIAVWVFLQPDIAAKMCLSFSLEAAPRTNSLSAEWLRYTARGRIAEHWHDLLNAISISSEDSLRSAVSRILPTGHTSGADSLGAFVACSRILLAKMDAQ